MEGKLFHYPTGLKPYRLLTLWVHSCALYQSFTYGSKMFFCVIIENVNVKKASGPVSNGTVNQLRVTAVSDLVL